MNANPIDSFVKIEMSQALVAKQRNWKGKKIIINETRSVSFHLDFSVCLQKEVFFLTFYCLKVGILNFPVQY